MVLKLVSNVARGIIYRMEHVQNIHAPLAIAKHVKLVQHIVMLAQMVSP
jgi:hypothetical protein